MLARDWEQHLSERTHSQRAGPLCVFASHQAGADHAVKVGQRVNEVRTLLLAKVPLIAIARVQQ